MLAADSGKADPDLLEKTFRIREFCRHGRLARTELDRKLDGGSTVFEYAFDLDAVEHSGGGGAWGAAFTLMTSFCKLYLDLDCLPVWAFANGRKYGVDSFHNTIGDFFDIIPILLEPDAWEGPTDMESLQSLMKQAGAKRFNFLTLMAGERASDPQGTLAVLAEQFRDAAVTFNFQGDAEGAAFRSPVQDQDAVRKDAFGLKRIHFVANQTGPKLNITLYLPFREEKRTLAGIFEKCSGPLQSLSSAGIGAERRMIVGEPNAGH
jgi:hypothetical protein